MKKKTFFMSFRLLFFAAYDKMDRNHRNTVFFRRMKKIILKTAFITFGITLILAVSLFGIVSFCAPAWMMTFCESLDLNNIGADYAYQEYQNTRDLRYLAHAFEVAAANKNYAVAEGRFEELYGDEGFDAYCKAQSNDGLPEGIPDYDYRAYLCGLAACVKYHMALALTDDDKSDVCAFAISETPSELQEESPLIALAIEAIDRGDTSFCTLLLSRIGSETKFDTQNAHYRKLIIFLEEAVK